MNEPSLWLAQWLRSTYEAAPDPRGGDDLVLSLSEVQAAFFVLAIGILVSSAALSAELLHNLLRPRRLQDLQPPHLRPQESRRRARPWADTRQKRPRPGARAHPPGPRPGPPPPYDGLPQHNRSTYGLAWRDLDPQVILTARWWKFQH